MPDRSLTQETARQVELPKRARARWAPPGQHVHLPGDRSHHDQNKPVPFVSVVMPVYNEEKYIRHAVQQALQQDYPKDRLELIVVDGMSNDRTREIIAELQNRHPNIRLIDNPAQTVSPGLNRALAAARGEIIVRLDGHCEYPTDYVRTLVALREEYGADTVGGVLEAVGDSYIQRCVGEALASPIGVRGAGLKAHAEGSRLREVDTAHGGCWRRERLLEVGGFDEEMVRNQDDELSFRLKEHGGLVLQHTAIRVKYHVRDSYKKLFKQFAQYGYWKVRVVRKHPQQSSPRHFLPGLFVLAVVSSVFAGLVNVQGLLLAGLLVSAYLGTTTLVTLFRALPEGKLRLVPGTVLALLLIHVGYGCGFLIGSLRCLVRRLPTDVWFERPSR